MVEEYDVVVVGAGPAGSSAARVAAGSGLRVLVLDRAPFPRNKTCGGGLIGPSLRAIGDLAAVPERAEVYRCGFSYRGGHAKERTASGPVIRTVLRPEFDAWLVAAAVAAGATFRDGCAVRSVEETRSGATVSTAYGEVRAGIVIAADGASGRLSRQIGVQVGRVDLGLEVELAAPPAVADRWSDRIHLDWGPLPGSYGWVFPKGETLTVGVIAARGAGDATRAYLRDLLRWQGLDGLDVLHDSGHLTRCRTPTSPVASARILAVGDAAGLLEPWTREGISFALRSGEAAGAACGVLGEVGEVGGPAAAYRAALAAELLPEMAAGERCLVAFERRPRAFHELITRTPVGWRGFVRLASGETTLARAMAHPSVRLGVGLLSR